MALIEWKEEFNTGVAEVDHEHRHLIDLINRLDERLRHEDSDTTVVEFLGEIFARISAHFALEEKVMRDRRYDAYDEHKADHERLLDVIRDIMDDYETGAYDDVAGTLSEHLERWFGEHFKTMDARLHKTLG